MTNKFYAIGIENPKYNENISSLLRSAYLLGANYVFIIGKSYKNCKVNTGNFHKLLPLFEFDTIQRFQQAMPKNCKLIGVDINNYGHLTPIELNEYKHYENEIFILGNETSGLSSYALSRVARIIYIKTRNNTSLNVATTGALICSHRTSQIKMLN